MKKLVIIIAACFLLASCGRKHSGCDTYKVIPISINL